MRSSPKPTGHTPPPDKKKEDKPSGSGNDDGKKSSRRTPPRNRASRSSSPRSRGSRNRKTEKPRERVVERVVRDSSSAGSWPHLTKTNYNEWSLRMRLKLQARDLWDVIEFGDGDYRDDRTALDAICSAVPSEMVAVLAVKETAAEAWEAIKTLRIGDERRRAVTAQMLRAEYENIKLGASEGIEDFALRFSGMLQRLAILEDSKLDAKALKKFLCVVCPRYKQLILSTEAFGNLSKLTIEEVTGTLKSSDDADEETAAPPPSSSQEKLLLTKEEWLEKYKQEEPGRGGSNSGSGGWNKSHGSGRTRGRGGRNSSDRRSDTGSSSRRAGPDDECKRCGKRGHWAQHCKGKLKVEAEAHVAHDDEPTLMFAYGLTEEESRPLTSLPPFIPSRRYTTPPTTPIHRRRNKSSWWRPRSSPRFEVRVIKT
jgi:hypothetical protein